MLQACCFNKGTRSLLVRCGVVARAVHVWAKHEARKASGPLQGEAAGAVRPWPLLGVPCTGLCSL